MSAEHNTHGFAQISYRSGVEVGSCQRNITQGGYAEHVFMFLFLGEVFQPECTFLIPLGVGSQRRIGIDVFKALSTQCGAYVASVATVVFECLHTGHLSLGEGACPFKIKVKIRIRRYKCFLKCSDSICDGFGRNEFGDCFRVMSVRQGGFAIAVHLDKKGKNAVIFGKFKCNGCPIIRAIVAHFYRIKGRPACLLLQVCCSAIPELADVGFCIVNSGGVYAAQLRVAVCAGHTLRFGFVICATLGEVVAACARNLVVCGKRRVEVQNVPQKNACLHKVI